MSFEREELLERAREHLWADQPNDLAGAQAWGQVASELLAQVVQVLEAEVRSDGGALGQCAVKLATEAIQRSPRVYTDEQGQALLAPGVRLHSLTISVVPGRGAWVDLRVATGEV